RARAKVVLDSVFGRVAQAAMALLLLALAALGIGSARVVAAITGLLAVGWVGTVVALKRPYLDLFRRALSRGAIDPNMLPKDLDLSAMEVVMQSLSSRDARRVIAAIDLLEATNHTKLIPGLILFHESEAVLLRALRLVDPMEREDWAPLVARLLTHPS